MSKTDRLIQYQELAGALIDLYVHLLGEIQVVKLEEMDCPTSHRLDFLRRLRDGQISFSLLSQIEAIELGKALLDGCAMSQATGAPRTIFEPLALGKANSLGRARTIRGELASSDQDAIDAWYFQLLVLASAINQGFSCSEDLKYDSRFAGQRVCEYALRSTDNSIELVECTRLSPSTADTTEIRRLQKKIVDRIDEKNSQFEAASNVFAPVNCRHILIDVSAYQIDLTGSSASTTMGGPVTTSGFTEIQIDDLANALEFDWTRIDVDHVSICWNTIVFVNHVPIAVVHRCKPAGTRPNCVPQYTYGGWTVQLTFPTDRPYHLISVKSKESTLEEIAYAYSNLADPDFWGKWTWNPNPSYQRP